MWFLHPMRKFTKNKQTKLAIEILSPRKCWVLRITTAITPPGRLSHARGSTAEAGSGTGEFPGPGGSKATAHLTCPFSHVPQCLCRWRHVPLPSPTLEGRCRRHSLSVAPESRKEKAVSYRRTKCRAGSHDGFSALLAVRSRASGLASWRLGCPVCEMTVCLACLVGGWAAWV